MSGRDVGDAAPSTASVRMLLKPSRPSRRHFTVRLPGDWVASPARCGHLNDGMELRPQRSRGRWSGEPLVGREGSSTSGPASHVSGSWADRSTTSTGSSRTSSTPPWRPPAHRGGRQGRLSQHGAGGGGPAVEGEFLRTARPSTRWSTSSPRSLRGQPRARESHEGKLGGQAKVKGVAGRGGPHRQRQPDGEQPHEPGAQHPTVTTAWPRRLTKRSPSTSRERSRAEGHDQHDVDQLRSFASEVPAWPAESARKESSADSRGEGRLGTWKTSPTASTRWRRTSPPRSKSPPAPRRRHRRPLQEDTSTSGRDAPAQETVNTMVDQLPRSGRGTRVAGGRHRGQARRTGRGQGRGRHRKDLPTASTRGVNSPARSQQRRRHHRSPTGPLQEITVDVRGEILS